MKNAGPRHVAREYALRELFAIHLSLGAGVEQLPHAANWWTVDDRLSVNREAEGFASNMLDGVKTHIEHIDSLIKQYAKNWRLERMPIVDRNILRLGAWEILHTPDTPTKVILNEALELAKCYGEIDSPRFVNGILDPLAKAVRQN